MLINWVNSIEYPNCLLASDIADFRDGEFLQFPQFYRFHLGIIFCELVNEVILKNRKPDFLTQVKNDNLTYQDSLHNINMALNEIKLLKDSRIPQNIHALKPHELISVNFFLSPKIKIPKDEDKVILVLDALYKLGNQEVRQESVNNNYNPFDQRRHSELDYATAYQSVPQPSLHHNKSDPLSTNSTQPSSSPNQVSNTKPILKPPRNTPSIPTISGKSNKSAPNSQLVTTRNEYTESGKDYLRDLPPPEAYYSHHYHHYPEKDFSLQNQSHNNYGTLNHHYESSQPRQPTTENSLYGSTKDLHQPRNENLNLYSAFAQNQTLDTMHNNNPFTVDVDLSRSIKSQHDTSRPESAFPRYHSGNVSPIQHQKRHESTSTPVQNPTAAYTNETQYNSTIQNTQTKSPGGDRLSTKSKRSAAPPAGPAINTVEDSKLNASAIKKRINHLKDEKVKVSPSPMRHSSSKERFSPFKKQETISSVKNTEQDRKIMIDDSSKVDHVVVTPVNEETKSRIMNWFYSITLIKDNVRGIEKKLPKICKDGVIFIDLINRIEGKHETIKGVNRKPETKTHVLANYQKLMNHLGKFEKMNPRYLFAQDYLIQGNEDVFWGLMDDIWHLYNKKASPYDPRYFRDERRTTFRLQASLNNTFRDGDKSKRSQMEMSYNDICYFDKSKLSNSYINNTSPSRIRSRSRSPSEHGGYDNRLNNSGYKSRKNDPSQYENSIEIQDSYSQGSKYEHIPTESYQQRYSKRSNMSKATNQAGPIKSIIKKGDASKFFSHSFTESEQNENNTTTVINPGVGISIEGEAQVFEWLKSLGFRALLMRDRSSLFNDPFRNGTLLCHVIGRVENERMHSLYKDPKSIDECRHNVYQAFQVLVRKQTPIPSYLKGKEEAVLRGDRSVILALLYSLMKINESKLDLNTSVITNNDKLYKQETSMYIPPYDDNDIERLERSLIGWMNSMGLFNDLPTVPHSLKELAIHFRNGVMLCDLTTIVTNARLTTIHRRPANENQCITNIRRALEILRTKKMMGQRYLWKEREIYNGNKFILLGLLEDLHRFFDGTAPRANPNYFLEGPYVPKPPESYQDERNVTERLHTNNKIEFVGIQPRSSARLVSPGRTMVTIAGGGANYSRRASRDGDMRPPESSRSRAKETQNPKLNISSDEPISIIDYERKGGKASVLNSPTRFQNGDTFLNSNMSRWESYSDNLGYKSPRSDIRKSGFPTDNNYPVHSAKLNVIQNFKLSILTSNVGSCFIQIITKRRQKSNGK